MESARSYALESGQWTVSYFLPTYNIRLVFGEVQQEFCYLEQQARSKNSR